MSQPQDSDESRPVALPPADFRDPVIEAYKKDIDRTLLRENLKLTPEQRFQKHQSFMRFFYAMREAGRHRQIGG